MREDALPEALDNGESGVLPGGAEVTRETVKGGDVLVDDGTHAVRLSRDDVRHLAALAGIWGGDGPEYRYECQVIGAAATGSVADDPAEERVTVPGDAIGVTVDTFSSDVWVRYLLPEVPGDE